MDKGQVFIISGPSGSGKDTLLVELFKKRPEIAFSISSITRDMREGEKEGEKYNFISKAQFEEMISNNQLLEYNKYVDNYYGTPRKPVEEVTKSGRDIIIEVDVNGAAQIREKLPQSVSIFIMPPSFDELERRLSGRGTESKELIEKRLKSALSEIKRAKEYDYIVVNREIPCAVDDIISIINSCRLQLGRQKNIINEVLKKC